MSETKWTKGPWSVDDLRHGRGSIRAETRRAVAEVWALKGDVPQEEMVANAHLIAAAPELYEALVPFAAFACEGETAPDHCHNCKARAALAKARGEHEQAS